MTHTNTTPSNREEWLNAVTNKYIRQHFADKGYTIPDTVRFSCSYSTKGAFKRKGQKRFVVGQCIDSRDKDGNFTHNEIVIVPNESDSIEVLDTLVHELCHATVGNGHQHNAIFANCAYAVGLEGKPTSTNATEALKALFALWIADLGEYPHQALTVNLRKQSTRLYKCECGKCGYKMRISRTWLDLAIPKCPLGHGKMQSEYSPEEIEE
jgi:hypothetical protein